MESVIAWELEDKLRYWLKSFSSDQLRLHGRTARLSNVAISGDALHAELGLPPALTVAAAGVGELEITLPSVMSMHVEPTVVNIDKLDIILEEKDMENPCSPDSNLSVPSSTKDNGYGYSDKIADGMTVKVGIVNLLIKARGGSSCVGGITWPTPLLAITIQGLMLYTTNEKWQVVSLKEAMDFSNNKKFIYVFKKMEWRSLSVDLKPHVDNFIDAQFNSSVRLENRQDEDGAIQMPYGGERVIEAISGEANITIQRTEQNNLLGLEFQVHIIEALSPALSEHGLLAFLSFITSLCVTLSSQVVDPKQKHPGAARSSSVSIIVDHVHFCIKDLEFQLELLVKSLFFSRASVPDGENCKTLSCIMVGDLVLRDTFVEPLCTLIQPSKEARQQEYHHIPDFGQSFCSIYPFGNQLLDSASGIPLLSLYSLYITPSPLPPRFSVETVIRCNPLTMTFQEQSCLRIASFLANGVVANSGVAVSPDPSIHSLTISFNEIDLSVVLSPEEISKWDRPESSCSESFSVARFYVQGLHFCQSPSAECPSLSFEKYYPPCSPPWEHQPIHASKRNWVTQAHYVQLGIRTLQEQMVSKPVVSRRVCIVIDNLVLRASMATIRGSPLSDVPLPEGAIRIDIDCHDLRSNITAEQLFFVLALYAYFGKVVEQISNVNRSSRSGTGLEPSVQKLTKELPNDTVMNLSARYLGFQILECSPVCYRQQLINLDSSMLFLQVSHHTQGSTLAVTITLQWEGASVECFNLERSSDHGDGIGSIGAYNIFTVEEELPMKKPMFWIDFQSNHQNNQAHFLKITADYVIAYRAQDVECCKLNLNAKISGVRLGGGMRYTESVLQRLGLDPDGGPAQGVLKGMCNLFSGPLAMLLGILADKDDGRSKEDARSMFDTGMPYDSNISVELKDWIFALEGTEEIGDWVCRRTRDCIPREVNFWQATFRNLHLLGKSSSKTESNSVEKPSQERAFPFECFEARLDGLKAIRPHFRNAATGNGTTHGHQAGSALASSDLGINVEATMVTSEDKNGGSKCALDKIRSSVKDFVIEAAETKEEEEHLSSLCRSEADSLGRIAAGVLRLLELDGSFGQAAIDQLANLGSGLRGIFTPEN